MVGVDSRQKLVFGDTLFRLNLTNMDGVVLFHNLRARDIHETNDFNIDRGDVWGEGHLGGYRVVVTGNSFTSINDRGDTSAGVNGRFYGHSHEFVGGTFIPDPMSAPPRREKAPLRRSSAREERAFEDLSDGSAAFALAASMNPMRKPPRLSVPFRIMREKSFSRAARTIPQGGISRGRGIAGKCGFVWFCRGGPVCPPASLSR